MTVLAVMFVITTILAGATEVTVHLHNEAGVAERGLRDAIEVAQRAFREARIPVRWLNCSAEPSGRCGNSGAFIYELVVSNSQLENTTGGSVFAMGYSLITADQPPVYAKVLLPRVMQYAEFADIRVSTALGYSIAHEVAHLLLRSNTHGNFGIMKARWSRSDARLLNDNRLKFHSTEVRRMQQALAVR